MVTSDIWFPQAKRKSCLAIYRLAALRAEAITIKRGQFLMTLASRKSRYGVWGLAVTYQRL